MSPTQVVLLLLGIILTLTNCANVPIQPITLFPRETETRELRSLDGIWDFRASPSSRPLDGFTYQWFKRHLRETGAVIDMPVPASYNDVTVDREIRDHVGVVWYNRQFQIPLAWKERRVWIRFGSVCHSAEVWVNGQLVASHDIGHLPFEAEVTGVVKYGASNLITVAVDNTLLDTTVPQGTLSYIDTGKTKKLVQEYTFDFFNYAGIDRPVILHTTPRIFINDVSVNSRINADLTKATVNYVVHHRGESVGETASVYVSLLDREGNAVVKDLEGPSGSFIVEKPKLWWPYLMHPDPAYLYTFEVRVVFGGDWPGEDIYRQPIGLREVTWDTKGVQINGKPIYIRGVGKHEDFDIKGKGLDHSVLIKDFNLMKWAGINTFRTSHYPYSEEMMEMADRHGIMVINECPSVDTVKFSSALLSKHKQSLKELYQRDKNRPSVIFWSVANEPRVGDPSSVPYFKEVIDYMRSLDKTRPITAAIASLDDKIGQYLDVYGFNRYYSWYTNGGHLEIVKNRVESEAQLWFDKYHKPIIMTEYGGDTFPGQHTLPETMWSEDYQVKLLSEHFKAFDNLRARGFFIGEMIWAFADFATGQGYTRVGGNKKGLFTRQRGPKAAAYLVRQRYHELAHQLDKLALPSDLYQYTTNSQNYTMHTEL